MFKRFQVMDIFHPLKDSPIKEWIDIKKNLPSDKDTICKVKLSNSNIVTAYFCSDKCINLVTLLGIKPSYWWNKQTRYNISSYICRNYIISKCLIPIRIKPSWGVKEWRHPAIQYEMTISTPHIIFS